MADKKFTLSFDFQANVGPLKSAVDSLQGSLSKVNLSTSLQTSIDKTFTKLNGELQTFEALSSKGFSSMADVKKAEISFNKITTLLSELNLQSSKIKGIDPKKLLPKESVDKVKELTKQWGALIAQIETKSKTSKALDEQNKELKNQGKAIDGLITKRNELAAKNISFGSSKGNLQQELQNDKIALEEVASKMKELESIKGGKTSADYKVLSQSFSELSGKISRTQSQIDSFDKNIQNNRASIAGYDSQIKAAKISLDNITTQIKELENAAQNPEGIDKIREALAKFKNIKIDEIPTDIRELQNVINGLHDDEIIKIEESIRDASEGFKEIAPAAKQAETAFDNLVDSGKQLEGTAQEVERLRNQVLQFFSIGNAVQLFKRAIRSAFDTVKELDATMTEAAVVTDFSVGDMWKQLPMYSEEATKLGASINALYGSTTLYYQQGLKTQAAMELSTETTKMARIANMDAVKATDLMTAALRGFNMELNKTSATHVNDVYSELAAITAADTEEIGVAMSKTASIASSANMQLETTAALLSQIIETTREAPETAGTAMKTIIARFTEVKELVSQGQLTGTDEEGEVINVNKIQKALRTVGVDMTKFFMGAEGLDDVLLDLASKWNGLNIVTQRYIATQAAGSRQQSRFLAMMSDYQRTTELVNAANNSAGASQEQFNKTLESMEAKLTKLKNAWDSFAMGLANNEILKTGIDILTSLLETINSLNDTISGGSGLIKSLLSLGLAIGGLKVGKKIFSTIFGGPNTIKGQLGGITNTLNEMSGKNAKILGASGKQAGVLFTDNLSKKVNNYRLNGGIFQNIKKDVKNNLKKAFDFKIDELIGFKKDDLEKQFSLKNISFPEVTQDLKNNLNKQLNQSGLDPNQKIDIRTSINTNNIDEAVGKYEKLGKSFTLTGQEAEDMGGTLKATSLNVDKIGMAAGIAGGLLMGLTSILENSGAISKETAIILKGVAIALMAIPIVLKVVQFAIKVFAKSVTTSIISIPVIGWIIGIVTALGVLAGVLVNFFKAQYANSLQGQLENAQKATEAAKKSAEAAKNAYEELLSGRSKYNELQETIDNLKVGTDGWKQALIEVNGLILELLTAYPKLAAYIQKDVNGQLTIAEEGWDTVIEEQRQGMVRSQSAAVASQMKEAKIASKQAEMALKKQFDPRYKRIDRGTYSDRFGNEGSKETLNRKYALYEGSGSDTDFRYDEELINQLRTFETTDGLIKGNAEFEKIAESSGRSAEELIKLIEAINTYDAAIANTTSQLKGQAESILTIGASDNTINSDFGQIVISAFADQMLTSEYDTKIAKKTEETYTNRVKEDKGRKEYMEKSKEEGGLGLTSTGDELKDLQAIYKELAQVDTIEDEDFAKNKDELANQIAIMRVEEEQIKAMEEFRIRLSNVEDKNTQKEIVGILSKGLTLTSEQSQNLSSLDETELESYAEELGYVADDTSSAAEKMAEAMNFVADETSTAAEKLLEHAQQIGEDTSDNFNSVKTKAIYANTYSYTNTDSRAGFEYTGYEVKDEWRDIINNATDLLQDATLEQYTGYIDQLKSITGRGGEEAAIAFNEQFAKLLDKDITEEQKQAILNMLSSFDFSNIDEVNNFTDYLKDIGVDLPTNELEELRQMFIDVGKATKNINLSTIIETSKELFDLADDLAQRADDVGLQQEEIDKLINNEIATLSDFVYTGQEWIYVGGSLQELSDRVAENTEATIKETLALLQGKISEANTFESVVDNADIDEEKKEELKSGKSTDIELIKEVFGYGDIGSIEIQQKYNEYSQNYGEREKLESEAATSEKALDDAEKFRRGAVNIQQDVDKLDNQNINSTTEYNDALVAQARQAGVTEAKIKEYEKALKDNKNILDGTTAAIITNATESKRAEKALNNTTTSVKEITDKYEDLKDITDEDIQNIGEALGIEDIAVDSENFKFISDNLSLIEQAAQGDIDAMHQLQEALAEHYGVILNAETGNIDFSALKGALDEVEKENLDVINQLLQAGAFEIETVTVARDDEYTVPLIEYINGKPIITGTKTESYKTGQTYQIIKPVDAPTIKHATGNSGGVSKTKENRKSGGGSKEKAKEWENPYDKFYNLVEACDKSLREITRYERDMEKLQREQNKILNTIDFKNNVQSQIGKAQQTADEIRRQYALQSNLRSGKAQQLQSYMDSQASMRQYAYYDPSSQEVLINYEGISRNKNEEKGQKIEEYVSKLEEMRDAMWGAEDAIYDAEDKLDELKDSLEEMLEELKQAYLDFEEKIKEALIQQTQKQIDTLQDTYDIIADSNSKVLSSLQNIISEQRKARELEETRQDIEEKQRRLSLLRQDSSGANALDIMALEEEIKDMQQSYTDSLIDEAINDLEEANQKAEEQRQQQIDLLQHQLDYTVENGQLWDEVNQLLASAINSDGSLNNNSALVTLLKDTDGYKAMSYFGGQNWWTDLQRTVAQAMAGLNEFQNPSNPDDLIGGIGGGNGGGNGSYNPGDFGGGSGALKASDTTGNIKKGAKGEQVEAIQSALQALGYDLGSKGVDGVFGDKTYAAVRSFQKKNGIRQDGIVGDDTRAKFRLVGYKEGGMADFTGPAWLDGTKAKPEAVLNAEDTQNFIKLRNILSSLMDGTSVSESSGDTYYEIHIEVESLANDYDVDQVADKVKRIINEDARYRNTNAINIIR